MIRYIWFFVCDTENLPKVCVQIVNQMKGHNSKCNFLSGDINQDHNLLTLNFIDHIGRDSSKGIYVVAMPLDGALACEDCQDTILKTSPRSVKNINFD